MSFSAERAEAAAEDIQNTCQAAGLDPSLDVQLLDLASLASVQDFVSGFKGKYDKCDVLMNNAVCLRTATSKAVVPPPLAVGTLRPPID